MSIGAAILPLRPPEPVRTWPALVPAPLEPAAEQATAHVSFEQLYRAHGAFVRRCLERLGVLSASVDDAAQDVFLVVFRQLERFRPGSSERAWLFAIAVRVASDHRRTRARRAALPLEERLVPTRDRTPLEHAIFSEAKQQLAHALEALPPAQREVYLLTELEELTAPEISERLGVNLSTVYTRLLTARKRIAEHLEACRERRSAF